MARPSTPGRLVPVVGAAMAVAAVFVVGRVLVQPSPCCPAKPAFVSLYDRPLSRVEAVLAEGDGQAFTALAQDPLLRRPAVMAPAGEFSYRAQRPVWGYLDWVASVGQPGLTGWALAGLTILSCGAAVGAVGSLLRRRGVSPWWSLVVPLAAVETLAELTPELLALTLLVAGILWWQRDRSVAAVVAFSLAALTRETMLVGVVAVAVWDLAGQRPGPPPRWRSVAPLLAPFAAYFAWIGLLTIRTGSSPFDRSHGRLGFPGVGLASSLDHATTVPDILGLVVLAGALCVVAVRFARRDVLTWVAVGYLLFGTLLGENVWVMNSGFSRSLLPLYTLGAVAAVGGVRTTLSRRPKATAGARAALRPGHAAWKVAAPLE